MITEEDYLRITNFKRLTDRQKEDRWFEICSVCRHCNRRKRDDDYVFCTVNDCKDFSRFDRRRRK